MIARRVLTALLFVYGAASLGDAPEALEWRFKVFLDDREIGHHDLRVMDDGTQTRVEIQAQFDVKVLFFTAYRYRHRNVETWEGGCLQRIESSTDINGERAFVAGRRGDDGFLIETEDGEARLPSCPMSFAYWKPEFLKASHLLNTQTGAFEPVEVEPRGETTVEYAGERLRAQRYDLVVRERPISLWYAADGRWLALETPARGDRTLRYEPVRIPRALEPETSTVSMTLQSGGDGSILSPGA